MAFPGGNSLQLWCQFCKISHFLDDDESANEKFFPDVFSYHQLRPRAVYEYIPLIPRLRQFYANPDHAKKMRYPETLREKPWSRGIRDIWDGLAMRHWQVHPEGSVLLNHTPLLNRW